VNGDLEMSNWLKKELKKIAETDDLHISPFREDGTTYGTPTWIWSVVVGDELFVRPYNGKNSSWYKAAVKQGAGRIKAAGITKEVSFEPANGDVNDLVDAAYQDKYAGSPYFAPMIASNVRSATIKITPLK
jgi:hypothetical protein